MFPQSVVEELDSCGRSLSDLESAVQDFGRRNPLLAKQLSDNISKLSETHRQTSRLADCRHNWIKKVRIITMCRIVYLLHLCCALKKCQNSGKRRYNSEKILRKQINFRKNGKIQKEMNSEK